MVVLVSSCKKEETSVAAPTFDLMIGNSTISEDSKLTLPTFVPLEVKLTSDITSSDRLLWDFGNGEQSVDRSAIFYYDHPGDYPISLTILNGSGSVSKTRSVQIEHRKIVEAKANTINIASARPSVQAANLAEIEIFLRIYKKSEIDVIPPLVDGTFSAEIIYESSPQKYTLGIDKELSFPKIDQSVMLIPPGQAGDHMGYCLYAKIDGKDHLLLSNWAAVGVSFHEDIQQRSSSYNLAYAGTSLTIYGAY